MFDRDELGVDPETDVDEDSEFCPRCNQLWEDCECDEEDEEDIECRNSHSPSP